MAKSKPRGLETGILAEVLADFRLKGMTTAHLSEEPLENTPGSGIFVLGYYSKREFLCLTTKGAVIAV